MQRLSVVLAATALVVALFGVTPLGNAARNVVKSGVSAAKPSHAQKASARGPRGRRGPRGLRGLRGLRGFQGPPGDRGDPGPATDGFEVRTTTPVTITGTTSNTANVVLDLPALPAGTYLFTAQLTVEGSGDGRVVCEARAPGGTGTYFGTGKTRVGNSVGAAKTADLSIVFGAQLAAVGTAQLRCWEEDGTSNDPSVTAAELIAVRTTTLTRN